MYGSKEEEKEYLLKLFKSLKVEEGDKIRVYTILRYVSNSGMLRIIDFFVIKDNMPINIMGSVETLLDYKMDKKIMGLRISGCGMDMGFHSVYRLSYALYGEGYKLRQEWI